METSAIAGSALLMKAAQTKESISISILKQAAMQQNQIVNLLAQNTAQPTQSVTPNNNSTFSTYA